MSFLTSTDYDVQIRSEIKAIVTQTSASLELAEQMAEAEMSSYLRPRGYDVPAIFAAVNTDRNPLLVMYMVDIVLYHIHSNIVTRAMPKTRDDRYTAAIAWLQKVNKGLLDPNLPTITVDGEDQTPTIKLGSKPNYSMRY